VFIVSHECESKEQRWFRNANLNSNAGLGKLLLVGGGVRAITLRTEIAAKLKRM